MKISNKYEYVTSCSLTGNKILKWRKETNLLAVKSEDFPNADAEYAAEFRYKRLEADGLTPIQQETVLAEELAALSEVHALEAAARAFSSDAECEQAVW